MAEWLLAVERASHASFRCCHVSGFDWLPESSVLSSDAGQELGTMSWSDIELNIFIPFNYPQSILSRITPGGQVLVPILHGSPGSTWQLLSGLSLEKMAGGGVSCI